MGGNIYLWRNDLVSKEFHAKGRINQTVSVHWGLCYDYDATMDIN